MRTVRPTQTVGVPGPRHRNDVASVELPIKVLKSDVADIGQVLQQNPFNVPLDQVVARSSFTTT